MYKNCLMRGLTVFKDLPQDIYNYTRITYPSNVKSDTPKFKGVPPHILILAEMEELRALM